MNTQAIIDAIRRKRGVDENTPIGVFASFCKASEVDRSPGNRDVISTITTGDIDQSDEVVMPTGAEWSYLMANRKVFVDHDYRVEKAVGHMRDIQLFPEPSRATGWRSRTGIYDKPGMKELCDDILYMAGDGGIGVSIGFEPTDYGPPTPDEVKMRQAKGLGIPRAIVRKWRGLEYSFTAFPCNVNCQGVAAVPSDTEKRMQAVDEMVCKGLIRRESAAALGLPITPRRKCWALAPARPALALAKVAD